MNLKLTPFFKQVIEMRWSEYCKLEQGEEHSSSQAVVLAVVRACANGKLPAIKESLNRIDGKLQEQIEVEYPKFYIAYPYAKSIEAKVRTPNGKTITVPQVIGSDTPPDQDAPLITGSLRDTLDRMSDAPKSLVTQILDAAEEVELKQGYAADHEHTSDPLVKSVIVAGLLKMAHNGSLSAIFEVFDNLDGKLVDKIKIMGDDVYLTSYDAIAPPSAKKNKDGVFQVEADNTTSAWAVSLKRKHEGV